MRSQLAWLLAAAGLGLGQASPIPRPASSNVMNAAYPAVWPDGRVTFQLRAPNASRVQLQPGGNDNGLAAAALDMVKGEDGLWSVTTPPAVPGFHYYWFMVDGLRVNDPGSQTYFGWARDTSGIEIPSDEDGYYLARDVPHGQVRMEWYLSKTTGEWRRAFVYTPPGYDSNTRARFPVLYLQHGAGENETGWTRQGRANFILDNLIAATRAVPMIVVMDHGYATALDSPPAAGAGQGAPARGGGASQGPSPFERVIIGDLIPAIDARYRTRATREFRAMAGLSMGSQQTLQITLRHLDTFSAIGLFSGAAPTGDFTTAYGGTLADAADFNRRVRLLWMGAGSVETRVTGAIETSRRQLASHGIANVVTFSSAGTAHEWQTWRRCLHDFAPRLFRN